jgi:hypothetical protein
MDKHLNLFFSYDRGGYEDPDKLKQLEDNVTRSFLVTIKNLSAHLQKEFLISLLGRSNNYSNLQFDLQNLTLRNEIPENAKKYLLTIGSTKSSFHKTDLNRKAAKKYNFERDERIKRELSKDVKILWTLILNDTNGTVLNEKLDQFEKKYSYKIIEAKKAFNKNDIIEELKYLYELVKGCRPDGWIYNERIIIAIEAKLNNNCFIDSQLSRHLFDKKNGLGIKEENEEYSIINITWDEIVKKFSELKANENRYSKDLFLIEEFKRYLDMSQRKLDLSFIISDEGYTRENAREQFPLLLSKLDEKIKTKLPLLERSKRPLADYIWDYYGVKNSDGKVQLDPHYSIYFDEDFAGISLTTKDVFYKRKKSQMERIIDHDAFHELLRNMLVGAGKLSHIELSRFFVNLVKYRLIDWKKGKQKGKTFDTFSFELNLYELRHTKEENFETVFADVKNQLKQLGKYAKQFEFGVKILYPKGSVVSGDEESMRSQNKSLFQDEDKLIEYYLRFISKTAQIFEDLIRKGN